MITSYDYVLLCFKIYKTHETKIAVMEAKMTFLIILDYFWPKPWIVFENSIDIQCMNHLHWDALSVN